MKRSTRAGLVAKLRRLVGTCSGGQDHELHVVRDAPLSPASGLYRCARCDQEYRVPHGPMVRAALGSIIRGL